MVTLRRMFLAVSTLSDIFSPLQQQILDPLANRKFLTPLPVPEELERLSDGDPKLELNSETLRNFSDRKILNTLQLLTVSSLLHMRQGFQLVQGRLCIVNGCSVCILQEYRNLIFTKTVLCITRFLIILYIVL